MATTEKRPVYPIHPGTVLAEELAELQMSPAELARELHVPSNRLYQLLAGKRAMTADTALRLEQWLGVEATFWMNLQKSYELDMATEQIGEEIKRTIYRRSPVEYEAPVIDGTGETLDKAPSGLLEEADCIEVETPSPPITYRGSGKQETNP